MCMDYAYSRCAVNNHTSCSFSVNLPVEVTMCFVPYFRWRLYSIISIIPA